MWQEPPLAVFELLDRIYQVHLEGSEAVGFPCETWLVAAYPADSSDAPFKYLQERVYLRCQSLYGLFMHLNGQYAKCHHCRALERNK